MSDFFYFFFSKTIFSPFTVVHALFSTKQTAMRSSEIISLETEGKMLLNNESTAFLI